MTTETANQDTATATATAHRAAFIRLMEAQYGCACGRVSAYTERAAATAAIEAIESGVAVTRAQVRRLLRRHGHGLYTAVVKAASAVGLCSTVSEDAPEGSVFSGTDVGEMRAAFGPFVATRRFVGVSGTLREVTYTRPDGETIVLARREPCGTWE